MPMCSATRRASYTSSIEQQRPCTDSGMPSCPASRRWFHSCMVSPMMLCPSARSMAATVEESTPPDMATAMVVGDDILSSSVLLAFGFWLLAFGSWLLAKSQKLRAKSLFLVNRRQFPQPSYRLGHESQSKVDVLVVILLAQAEADTGARSIRTQPHSQEYV